MPNSRCCPPPEPIRPYADEVDPDAAGALLRLAYLLAGDRGTAESVVAQSIAAQTSRGRGAGDRDGDLDRLMVDIVRRSRRLTRRSILDDVLRRADPPPRRLTSADQVGDEVGDAVLGAADHRAVTVAVSMLPPRQREVIALRYWTAMTDGQLARAVGLSAGAISSTSARALAGLADLMTGMAASGGPGSSRTTGEVEDVLRAAYAATAPLVAPDGSAA